MIYRIRLYCGETGNRLILFQQSLCESFFSKDKRLSKCIRGKLEVIQELSNFRQIWDAFLMPVISSIVIFVFITILFGKNFLYELYRKYGFVKISNKYYKHKYIRVNKEKKVILLPISKEMENIIVKLQKPVIIIPLVLVISYILYQLIGIIDTLYPVSYFYTSPNNLLCSVPKYTIAEIWTYFPEYNIENLNTKINIWGEECSYAKYYDYSGILLIGSVCKFCSLLCIIKFFICRTHIKEYLRTSILLAMCLLGILLSYYLQFQKQSEVLEQRAYYVRSKLVMGNPAVETDYDNFQISYEKVENELRYIDDKIFYGAFGIEISAGKVARKSITL